MKTYYQITIMTSNESIQRLPWYCLDDRPDADLFYGKVQAMIQFLNTLISFTDEVTESFESDQPETVEYLIDQLVSYHVDIFTVYEVVIEQK